MILSEYRARPGQKTKCGGWRIPWDLGGVSNVFSACECGEGAVSVCIGDPMGSHGLRYSACRVRVDGMLLILSCAVPHFTVTGFYASVSGFHITRQ